MNWILIAPTREAAKGLCLATSRPVRYWHGGQWRVIRPNWRE